MSDRAHPRAVDGPMPSTTGGDRHTGLVRAVVATVFLTVLAALELIGMSAASATVSPIVDGGPGRVTADPLPTVQMNGVVWDQEVVGNTVYATGEFTSARPAGSPLGSNETPRSNILAYNLTTGNLITSFNPSLDRQGKNITASPDGSRIYVAGNFTSVSGVSRTRIVALDAATGAVITAFNPQVDYVVNTLVATNTTVYAGGPFNYAGPGLTATRSHLAAFSATNGALLPWAPTADNDVHSMLLSPDGTRLIAAGKFRNVNGAPAAGTVALDPTTGATLPWAANNTIKIGGTSAAVLNLTTDGTLVYATSYTYGREDGNLESAFAADISTGEIKWIEDCHGDAYDGVPLNGYLYVVDHAHFCANVGGYPQSDPWYINQRDAQAFTTSVTGTLRREPWGYFNWEGKPSPSLTNWFPEWEIGTYTGQFESGWTVEGNSNYVVVGGEFLRVNNTPQQGLVRFAVKPIAPAKSGPRLSASTFPVNVSSTATGQARISFAANWDRDSYALNYRIVRNGNTASPVYQTSVNSTFWNRPTLGFTDTGLTPGVSYTYRVYANDSDGNQATSDPITITIAGSGSASAYADAVMADSPLIHWRLGESAGATTAAASEGSETGVRDTNASFGAAGAMTNESNTAASFTNSSTSRIYDPNKMDTSDDVTVEAWVRTSSTTGGRILGMGNSLNGSSSANDRVLYMTNNGRVTFAVRPRAAGPGPGSAQTRLTVESAAGLNNNQWHHLVGTLGEDGMRLYVDGVQVAARTDAKGGQAYNGYWRVGADTLSGWANRPTTDFLTGQIDEPAVYYKVLSAARVATHYAASGRGGAIPNSAPSASFTATPNNLTAAVDASASTDTDGTITSYAWNFGDGGTATGVTASHLYATAGSKVITLTVTDDDGATATTTRTVTVSAPPPNNVAPTASFTATPNNLTAAVNASASTDTDGTITSYAWNFGDTTSGTGVTTSHVYATAGTYTITLTVTDDDGATGSTTRSVTVTAPGATVVYATDAFTRTVANAWGAADLGGTWSLAGTAADYAVNNGTGRITLGTPGISRAATLNSVAATDIDNTVDFTLDKTTTGGGVYLATTARKTGNSEYRFRIQVKPTGASLQLQRVVNGTETILVSQNIPDTYTPGTVIHLKLRATGSGTTTLSGKAWFGTNTEPATWNLQTTDTTAALQAPGAIGIHTYISGTATNAPIAVTTDNVNTQTPN